MPTDFWFRLSTYLSLVLACLCLGYAEWTLLPEVTAFAVLVVVLLGVSFALDRRFELSLMKANALGLGIGVVAFVWGAWQLASPREAMAAVEWPTNLLPIIGPVLLALIPAKLFRPKHVGDWWAMYGVGVAGVALASSMADDAAFVGLMAAYLLASAWALVLFFYRRSGGFIAPVPGRPAPPQAQLATAGNDARPPRGVFARTLVWVVLAAAVAVPLFVALPRTTGTGWSFGHKQYVTGSSDKPKLTMNKSGDLQESDTLAFRVTATAPDGGPADLDPDQHWRGGEYITYEYDTAEKEWAWARAAQWLAPVTPPPRPVLPPAADPDGVSIRFEVTARQPTPVLASPVRWRAGRHAAWWADGGKGWEFRPNGVPTSPLRKDARNQPPDKLVDEYVQSVPPPDPDAPDLGTPLDEGPTQAQQARLSLLALPSQNADTYRKKGEELLDRLIRDGHLPADCKQVGGGRHPVPEAKHEQVARAFAAHFATSGEYTYSTKLEPKNRKIDPLLDFLDNIKSGHCEWYAGSLALLLRGVGVPCQLVTGFRGWDADDGGVVIRDRHAHAWVEALVSRPPPPGYQFQPATPPDRRQRVWHWLTLDSTPGVGAPPPPKNWLQQGAALVADFLLKFDKDKRERVVQSAAEAAAQWWPAVAVGLIGLLSGWVFWRILARSRPKGRTFDGPDWYARFQAVLAARGLVRTPGQTPRELADAAEAAGLPADPVRFVTSKLYRVRYAGSPLTPDEVVQVAAAVAELEQAVARPANGAA